MLEQQAVAYPNLSEEELLLGSFLRRFRSLLYAKRKRHFRLRFVLGSLISGRLHRWRKEYGDRVVGKHGKGGFVSGSLC